MTTKVFILVFCVTVAYGLGDGQYRSKTSFSKKSPQPQFLGASSGFQAEVPAASYGPPSPYSFGYEADGSAREETADASGKVTGSYSVINEDGSKRLVKYIADDMGFRAQVDTDEPGTKSDNPADIQFNSAAKIVPFTPVKPVLAKHAPTKFSAIKQEKFDAPVYQQKVAQYSVDDSVGPSPYSFSYHNQMEDGSSSHSQSADASGKVTGSYSLSNADGRKRTVEYSAGSDGFQASITTNEFGTKSDAPAHVQLSSSAVQPEQGLAEKSFTKYQAPQASGVSYHHQQQQKLHYAPAQEEVYGPPAPYAFDYLAELEDGGFSSRKESSDGSGKVTGSYKLGGPDGRQRIVEYIADHNGFRANVNTNEFGTKSDSPSDVMFFSSAPEEEPAPYKAPQQFQGKTRFQQHKPSFLTQSKQQSFSSSHFQPQKQEPFAFGSAQEQKPLPYSFSYQNQMDDGSSAHHQSLDSSGRVVGSYNLATADGQQRKVEYTAGEDGFKAIIKTNEFGTKSESPADAIFQSSASVDAQNAPTHFSGPAAASFHSASLSAHSKTAPSAPRKHAVQQAPAFQHQPQQKFQEFGHSPFSFGYKDDSSTREESADKSGKVTGSYSVTNEDGSTRLVEYIADEQGFRAKVKTNEPGTKSDNPADVILHSTAPEAPLVFAGKKSQEPIRQQKFPEKSFSSKTSVISQESI